MLDFLETPGELGLVERVLQTAARFLEPLAPGLTPQEVQGIIRRRLQRAWRVLSWTTSSIRCCAS